MKKCFEFGVCGINGRCLLCVESSIPNIYIDPYDNEMLYFYPKFVPSTLEFFRDSLIKGFDIDKKEFIIYFY